MASTPYERSWIGRVAPWPLAVALAAAGVPGCVVHEVCFTDADCPGAQVCDVASGGCGYQCHTDADCGLGFTCDDHLCVFHCAGDELSCPEGAVSVCGVFCIDTYEASRPDATDTSPGSDDSRATSRPGVMPWYSSDAAVMNRSVAAAACEAAGKRLCTTQEWRAVCRGPDDLDYCYGNDYDPLTCNGIDTYCECDPYPHCYDDCGASFHAVPTGSFPGCTNEFGIYDINGNVWELVDAADGLDHYRGGAYNCKDSETLHGCNYDATWDPSAKGFRCCADGEPVAP